MYPGPVIDNPVDTALWRSEERLRLAQDAGGVASWEFDLVSGEVQWSPSGFRLYGLAPDWRPSYGNFLALVHPEDRERVRYTVECAIATRRAIDHQFRIVTPDGEQRWIVSRAKFIDEANTFERTDGPPGAGGTRLFGVDIDITSLKETEQRLLIRERELERLQQIAGVGEFQVDLRPSRECWYSPGYLSIHGLGLGETERGEEWVHRVHPDDRPRAKREFDDAVAGGLSRLQTEYRIVRPVDGETRWIEASIEIERDFEGTAQRLIGAHRDVTERRMAEERARISEERLRYALDASHTVGIWEEDVASGLVFADLRVAGLLSLDPKVAAGGVPVARFLDVVHAQDRPEVERQLEQTMSAGGDFSLEYRLVAANGETRWVSDRGRVELDANMQPVRAVGVLVDITGLKQLQTAQEAVALELVHRIKNLFSVISALSSISARESSEAVREYASNFRKRLYSLSRALIYMQPKQGTLSTDAGQSAFGLLRELLSPFDEGNGDRMKFDGADISVDNGKATILALLVHELATNAVKYGSLSNETGTVSISGAVDAGAFVLTWRERGGPPVAGPPRSAGFGTGTTARLASAQLGGAIDYAWEPVGLSVTIRMPLPAST